MRMRGSLISKGVFESMLYVPVKSFGHVSISWDLLKKKKKKKKKKNYVLVYHK